MARSEEHTSELQSRRDLVCRLLLEKKKTMLRGTGLSITIQTKDQFNATFALSVPVVDVGALDRCAVVNLVCFVFFFFNDTATTEIYTLSLHDALPIASSSGQPICRLVRTGCV